MADQNGPKLSEEEIIEKKLKFRRMISNVLIVLAVISIGVFTVMMFLTKGNIDTQTALDTQELRSKLKQIISFQNKYYAEHGTYVQIKPMQMAKELPDYSPNIDGNFKYSFDPKTGIAEGYERDVSNDVNGDDDGRDGLSLSIDWVPGETDGSNFFWTDEDKADLKARADAKAANPPTPPAVQDSTAQQPE